MDENICIGLVFVDDRKHNSPGRSGIRDSRFPVKHITWDIVNGQAYVLQVSIPWRVIYAIRLV